MSRKVSELKMLEREIKRTRREIEEKQLELGGLVVEVDDIATQIRHQQARLIGMEREFANKVYSESSSELRS